MDTPPDITFHLSLVGLVGLEVVRFELKEGLCQPFRLDIELASHDDNLGAAGLLDCTALFSIAQQGRSQRQLGGIVTAFEQGTSGFRRTRYHAVVESPLARLALRHNSRIFQRIEPVSILSTLLKEHDIVDVRNLCESERPYRQYCVQYRESDLDFFHRLAAEEGVVYWHAVEEGRGVLVLADTAMLAPGLPQHEPVILQTLPAGQAPVAHLSRFNCRRQLAPTQLVQRDYSFHLPHRDLEHQATPYRSEDAVGQYPHYDPAGRYKDDRTGRASARRKLIGLRNEAAVATLEGDDARLCAGTAFVLSGRAHAPTGDDWRVVTLHHWGEQASSQGEEAASAASGSSYRYTGTAVSVHMDWRPAPPPRRVIDGPQIAHVTGPEGEEIHCDAHGRVQVWFPWDRQGKRENSTCWIRVSQGWAGTMFGAVALPRVGHEVIVSFLEGDPDQPIITGRTYHVANLPPYPLPLHKTRTTLKTKTHKGDGYNELRFDDAHDREEVFIHAQRDYNTEVGNDRTSRIGNDRSDEVVRDDTLQVGHDRRAQVDNDDTLRVQRDRRLQVDRDQLVQVQRDRQIAVSHDLTETVGNTRTERTTSDRTAETGGQYQHRVAGHIDVSAGSSLTQRAETIILQATDILQIRGPGGTITVDGDGVTIEGLVLRLKGPVRITEDGAGNALQQAVEAVAAKPPSVCAERLRCAATRGDALVVIDG